MLSIPRDKVLTDEQIKILIQMDKMDDVDIAADGEVLKYPKGWIVGNKTFVVVQS